MKLNLQSLQEEFNKKSERYAKIRFEFRSFLIEKLREVIRDITASCDSRCVHLDHLYQDSNWDRMGKFYCFDDEADNYFLSAFSVDEDSGRMSVLDESGDYEFDEDDFDTPELQEILQMMLNLAEGLQKGTHFIGRNGFAYELASVPEFLDEYNENHLDGPKYLIRHGRFFIMKDVKDENDIDEVTIAEVVRVINENDIP